MENTSSNRNQQRIVVQTLNTNLPLISWSLFSRGFKDTHTAELMMRRAKKLKYNTENKKKISKLGKQMQFK